MVRRKRRGCTSGQGGGDCDRAFYCPFCESTNCPWITRVASLDALVGNSRNDSGILHEGEIDKRVQYTIEGLFAIRKGNFEDYPAICDQLDLVEGSDQITHEIGLDDVMDKEELLDLFSVDPDFRKNELFGVTFVKRFWENPITIPTVLTLANRGTMNRKKKRLVR